MSRVFVSSAYRDRAMGERVGGIVRSLGHDVLDDQDEASGAAWWNEVVGRIESSDVFVALVSPSYGDASTCRLAAKHAAAAGLPVVRLDLGDDVVTGCHPAVASATRMRFTPDGDLRATAQLARALGGPPEPPQVVDLAATDPPRRWVGPPVVIVTVAVAMVVAGLAAARLHRDGGPGHGSDLTSSVTSPAATSSAPTTSATQPHGSAPEPGDARGVLTGIVAADTPRLPSTACRAGDHRVTCRNAAPGVRTVVLGSYPTREELYAAYVLALEGSSGAPVPENVGECTPKVAEGEVSWNLQGRHRRDLTVEQEAHAGIDPVSGAAGRVYCATTSSLATLVWTQDPGLLVVAVGERAPDLIHWWQRVHLDLACTARGGEASATGCRGLVL